MTVIPDLIRDPDKQSHGFRVEPGMTFKTGLLRLKPRNDNRKVAMTATKDDCKTANGLV
jgi:hypothetical protein